MNVTKLVCVWEINGLCMIGVNWKQGWRGGGDILLCRVVKLVLAAALEGLLDIGVEPQILDGDGDLMGHVLALDLHGQAHDDDGIVAVRVVEEWQFHCVHCL